MHFYLDVQANQHNSAQTRVQTFSQRDPGGDQAFYSDDPSSHPAESYVFSVKFMFEKNENKQKEAEVGHF